MLESDLIASARQGEAAGWEALVYQHQDAVFRLAYLLMGDADDAQDVAQEAFLRAYRAMERFDPARPLRPWLLSITANLARNRQRSVARYLAAVQRLARGAAESEPMVNVEGESLRQIEAQTLWQAVRRLNPADQRVIYLRFFLELPEAEMATALDVAAGTVKSRLHRALKRLRTVVTEEFPTLQEKFSP